MLTQMRCPRHDVIVSRLRTSVLRPIVRLVVAGVVVSLLYATVDGAGPPVSADRTEAATPANLQAIRNEGGSWVIFGHVMPDEAASYVATFTRHAGTEQHFIQNTLFGPGVGTIWGPGPLLPEGIWNLRVDSTLPVSAVTSLQFAGTQAYADSNQAEPGRDVAVAPVVKRVNGGTSLLAIQNAGNDEPVDVRVSFHPASGGPPVLTLSRNIPAASGALLDLRTEEDRQLWDLPCGFDGWARVQATAPVAVSSLVDMEGSPGLMSFEGMPIDLASPTLHAPLVGTGDGRHASFGTRLVVLNPGTTEVEVSVTYRGIAGSCAASTIPHAGGSLTIAAGSIATFHQSPVGALSPAGSSGLPAGCVAAADVTAIGGGVIGTVLIDDVVRGHRFASAYGAALPRDASARHIMVYVNSDASSLLTSNVIALNPNATAATTSIVFNDWSTGDEIPCKADACEKTIPPRGGIAWWAHEVLDDSRAADRRQGLAVVSSDLPVIVLHRQAASGSSPGMDSTASYAMWTHRADGSPRGVPLQPLFLRNYTLPDPTPCSLLLPLCSDMWFLPGDTYTHP